MALASNALTDLATVKDDLGISDTSQDARLERLVNMMSDAIERYCGRHFQRATRTEKVAGSGTLRLVLTDVPLVSVTSITDEDGGTIDASTYEVEDAEAGIVVGDTPWPAADLVTGIAQDPVPGTGRKNLTVVYVAGYVLPGAGGTRTLPYDLEDACVRAVVTRYRARGRDGAVVSESMGDASVSYAGTNTAIGRGVGGELPDDVIPTLDRYRRYA